MVVPHIGINKILVVYKGEIIHSSFARGIDYPRASSVSYTHLVSGYGPTQIANMLTEREILCPTYYALERGEKPRTVLPPHKYAWNGPVVAMILDLSLIHI